MNYQLIVLTHDRDSSAYLGRSLSSFREHVRPAPASVYVHADGNAHLPSVQVAVAREFSGVEVTSEQPFTQAGFCRACAAGWRAATVSWHPYVFWLEHDFVLTRTVDLRDLAHVLDEEPRLAQMALMRNAVSSAEVAAGGLVESRPGQYTVRAYEPPIPASYRPPPLPWLEHRSYFTTNPSLMRREFMAENPWPAYPAECEGRFGIDLAAAGYSFGVWGSGEPWVEHIGVRSGVGY